LLWVKGFHGQFSSASAVVLLVTVALVALANIHPGAPAAIRRRAADAGAHPGLAVRAAGSMACPWHGAVTAGGLMGTKIVRNELIAYLDVARMPAGTLDSRAAQIMVHAMCGFANLVPVGILIAGMGAPARRDEIVPLALKALLSGAMASGLSGRVIGLLPL
jgi:CNT family concentrative nucleoside transporter